MTPFNSARPFTVHAGGPKNFGAWAQTHCKTLKGAVKSATGFHSDFESIKILFEGEVIQVVR